MIQTTTLKNGTRIVTEKMPGLLSASVGIWVNRGSRHERVEENGIAHFLEHMAFKGTGRRSALDIANDIENVGGYLNAYTSRDTTAYYARILGQDMPLALDILTDIVVNPAFDNREIEVERGVILQEIGQSKDTPDDIIFDWLQETAFPDQPVGRAILGSEANVRNFTGPDFRKFVGANYGGDNLIVAAAGDVDHEAIVKQVEEGLSDLKYQSARDTEGARPSAGHRRIEKALEQAHFTMSLPAPSLLDPDYYAGQVYAVLMGGGLSSRLFQEIREKRGLAYTIFASLGSSDDMGQFLVYAGTGADQIDELLGATADVLRTSCDHIREDEIERAKAQLRASAVMGLESASNRAERLARATAVHGYVPDLEKVVEKIDAVDGAALKAFAEKLLQGELASVLYGPVSGARDHDAFTKLLRG